MLLDTPTPSASDRATITPSQELAENIAAWTKPPARNSHRSAYSDDSAHWELNETLKKSVIFWEVKRPDIEALRFDDVVGLFLRLQSNP